MMPMREQSASTSGDGGRQAGVRSGSRVASPPLLHQRTLEVVAREDDGGVRVASPPLLHQRTLEVVAREDDGGVGAAAHDVEEDVPHEAAHL